MNNNYNIKLQVTSKLFDCLFVLHKNKDKYDIKNQF